VLRWAVYEAGNTHARTSAPDHGYYAAVADRKNGKRAARSEARKIVRQACHILAELGDDALTRSQNPAAIPGQGADSGTPKQGQPRAQAPSTNACGHQPIQVRRVAARSTGTSRSPSVMRFVS
jgi:hypothetical protein